MSNHSSADPLVDAVQSGLDTSSRLLWLIRQAFEDGHFPGHLKGHSCRIMKDLAEKTVFGATFGDDLEQLAEGLSPAIQEEIYDEWSIPTVNVLEKLTEKGHALSSVKSAIEDLCKALAAVHFRLEAEKIAAELRDEI